jgi:membrane protein required for colicin V production
MSFNFIDIFVLIPLLWGAFKGFKNGFISEGGTVIAIIIGIWASVKFAVAGGNFVAKYLFIGPQYQEIVAFSLIFLLVVILSFFVTKLIANFFKSISLEWLDKLLGILFGAAKYMIIIAFFFFLIDTIVQKYSTKKVESFEKSLFFKPLSHAAKALLDGNIKIPGSKP